jgi:hypothetical protein
VNKRAAARVEEGTMYTVKRKGEKSRLHSTCAGFDDLAAAENAAVKKSRATTGVEFRVVTARDGATIVSRFVNGKRADIEASK